MARLSVRTRLTGGAAVVTALVLLAAAVVLVVVFQRTQLRNADDLARTRLAELSTRAEAGDVPAELTDVGDDGFGQVVAGDRVVAASPNLGRAGPVTGWRPGPTPQVAEIDDVPDDDETEDYRVWAATVEGPDGPVTIYLGTAREALRESARSLVGTLAVGLPVLWLVAVALLWVLVGRTLRPVEAAHARQREFVADAAHELQSPLAAYRSRLEVALRHDADADWRSTARGLLADSDRMERLVRDLLFVARHDEPQPTPDGLVDLDDVVLEEVTRLRPSTGVELDTSRVSGAPVRGSRDDLARLVRNLLANAVRHASGRVSVSCAAGPDGVLLTVEDDGPGIPAERRDEVFGRFVRGDPARGHDDGTGLGLSIVQAVAERHGGSVRVSDAEAGGARLEVRLPDA